MRCCHKVSQVLANAVAEKNIDVSSISSMELSLSKADVKTSIPEPITTALGGKTAAVAFEVHPVATVTTKIGDETSTTTYDVSNEELANNASFTFKLTGLTAGKSYTLYHYASNGDLKNTFFETADANGEVTLTLTEFSYIVGEESTPVAAGYYAGAAATLTDTMLWHLYVKVESDEVASIRIDQGTFHKTYALSELTPTDGYYIIDQYVFARRIKVAAVITLLNANGDTLYIAPNSGGTPAESASVSFYEYLNSYETYQEGDYWGVARAIQNYGTEAQAVWGAG